MASLLLVYRYASFVIFTICSAVVCSVAVWNYTLARSAGLAPNVDIFLAVLGGLGLIVIIPITFIDILRRNALPTRVWVECVWVALFWMLYLAGASAATSMLPDMMCSPLAPLFPGYSTHSCVSTNVLLAFSWLCMSALLVYLVALTVSAVMHHEEDLGVWQSNVRFFPWYATRSSLPSAPPSPKTWQRPFALVVPQPKHAEVRGAAQRMDVSADVAAAPPVSRVAPVRQTMRPIISQPQPAASMYPPHVQSNMSTTTRAPPQPPSPTPPPLGDWPRSVHQQRQQRSARKPAPFATLVSTPSEISQIAMTQTIEVSSTEFVSPRTLGGSGRGSPASRRRSPPPPLDLSKISSYNRHK